MFVRCAPEGVRIEAVLEGVEDIAATGALRPGDDEQDDGHQEDDNCRQDHDDHSNEVGVVRLLIDGAWCNYCNESTWHIEIEINKRWLSETK